MKEGGTPWTFERLASRYADPHIAAAMAQIGFPTPESLLATFLLDAKAIRRSSARRRSSPTTARASNSTTCEPPPGAFPQASCCAT